MLRWLRHLTVTLILALSVYIGFGNTDDITNTITTWQRLAGRHCRGICNPRSGGVCGICPLCSMAGPRAWDLGGSRGVHVRRGVTGLRGHRWRQRTGVAGERRAASPDSRGGLGAGPREPSPAGHRIRPHPRLLPAVRGGRPPKE